MPIPASFIVSVVPRLISPGGRDLEFNGLFLTQSAIIPYPQMVETFTSADAVAKYFGAGSQEHNAAVDYFRGYQNSFRKPARIHFASLITTESAAFLRSGEMTDADLETLTAISDGAFVFNAGGAATNISSVSLTSCTSFSAIATAIQAKLTSANVDFTVTFNASQKKFFFTDNSTGDTSTVDFAGAPASGTNLAAAMKLTAKTGAVVSQGHDFMNIPTTMNKIVSENSNWVAFTTVWLTTDDTTLRLSKWASDKGVDYLYVPWSTSVDLPNKTAGNVAELIAAAGYGATALVYGPRRVASFVLGMIASIDWERWQGVISTAFKHAEGLAANVIDETEAANLESQKCNYVGKFATRNDEFTFFYDGSMFGDYRWIDNYINAIWLKNTLQVSCMNGLTNVGRVPYNERGYAFIRSWLQDPLNRAIRNGCIDTGLVLSESQKVQVAGEAGRDISQELWVNGYFVQVEDAGAAVRVERDSPNIAIWYTYAGSVNRLNIPVTMIA